MGGVGGKGGSSSPVLTVKPHGDSGQRPCVPAPRNYSFSFGMVRAGINTFECFLHLSAYSLLSTSNPPLFLCALCIFTVDFPGSFGQMSSEKRVLSFHGLPVCCRNQFTNWFLWTTPASKCQQTGRTKCFSLNQLGSSYLRFISAMNCNPERGDPPDSHSRTLTSNAG